MRTTSTIDSKSSTSKNKSVKREENSGCLEQAIGMLMTGLSILFMIVSYSYQQTGSVSRLRLGVGLTLVMIVLCVISVWGYVNTRYKIRKQIKAKYGYIDRRKFKEELNRDKYYTWFIVIIIGLTLVPFWLLVFFMIIDIVFSAGVGGIEIVFMPFYMLTDFFFGNETDVVTYISESSYIYPETTGNKVRSTDVYGHYVVNFQTGDGEILSLIVEQDQDDPNGYLEEVRSFNNTEIKYISRTGVYVP